MKHPIIFGCLTAAFALSATVALADDDDRGGSTKTPIKHLVVIFQENVSFDHYFGTYPNALNLPGETPFKASKRTPKSVNNLLTPLDTTNHFVPLLGVDLIHNNPNSNPAAPGNGKVNGADAANPFRLSPAQALTTDQGHNESPEESAYNNGRMDGFPAWVGTAGGNSAAHLPPDPPPATVATKGLTMGYYDGNTVTALWNYAQHFALNDNHYTTQFGPSTPGALNLVSGQANGLADSLNIYKSDGVTLAHSTHEAFGDAAHLTSNITVIGDGDPKGDVCSNPSIDQVTMAGKNIGDLLNQKGISWGSFMGGFDLSITNPNGTKGCGRETDPKAPGTPAFTSADYIPHHAWFQYYASTANYAHTRPSSVAAIGHSFIPHTKTPEPANHEYDSHDFFDALNAGNLPAVSFLKAPAYQDGHAGYSDPLDEQTFLVDTINALQNSRFWRDTAVVIAYDDSDGWYDHQMPPVVNPSFSMAVDTLNAPGVCNHGAQQGTPTPPTPLNGAFGQPVQGRCGYGTRMPLIVVSPWAKKNFVDHTLTDQSSILRFIEDNWLHGERIQPGGSFDTIAGTLEHMFDFDRDRDEDPRVLVLDPLTGAVVFASQPDDDDDHDRR
jgi:phospholipase C